MHWWGCYTYQALMTHWYLLDVPNLLSLSTKQDWSCLNPKADQVNTILKTKLVVMLWNWIILRSSKQPPLVQEVHKIRGVKEICEINKFHNMFMCSTRKKQWFGLQYLLSTHLILGCNRNSFWAFFALFLPPLYAWYYYSACASICNFGGWWVRGRAVCDSICIC